MSDDPAWDAYFIPGTRVLRNNLGDAAHPDGTTNPINISRAEHDTSLIRMAELLARPVDPAARFDLDHARAIHRHLFSDVYPWAGEIRTGPREGRVMTKNDIDVVAFAPGDVNAGFRDYAYAPIAELRDGGLEHAYRIVEQLNYLQGLDHDQYVTALATVWGTTNYMHFAREGNTRTQSVYFAQLAERGGYNLDLTRFSFTGDLRTEFINARNHNLATMQTDRLAAVIDKVLSPVPEGATVDRAPTIGALLAATRGHQVASQPRRGPHPPTSAPPMPDVGRDRGHGVGD